MLTDLLRSKLQQHQPQPENLQADPNAALLKMLQERLTNGIDSGKEDASRSDLYTAITKSQQKHSTGFEDNTTQFSTSNASAIKYLFGKPTSSLGLSLIDQISQLHGQNQQPSNGKNSDVTFDHSSD